MISLKLIGQLFLLLLCFYSFSLSAQLSVPQVGSSMEFAGMELRLTEKGRKDIQASVNALYRSEKFFGIMLERVDLYMPVIENILLEKGVPEDFKYLVIQESALIPDAVSSSNAVGFWQFKEASATELDMRVDRQVDERMNIVSATEGAAKYFLRSNAEFDNWLYSLLSYMMGQGGASRSVDKRLYGARKMTIDGDTHWYIKKFLSHMVAFEHAIGQNRRSKTLYLYTNTANKSLRQIAREFDTEEALLQDYNKWLKTNHIPDDKAYTVVVPLNISESEDLLAQETGNTADKAKEKADKNQGYGNMQQPPEKPASTGKQLIVELNDLEGIVARAGDSAEKLAQIGDISERRFLRYNDLEPGDQILPGQFYYFEKKRARARVYEHVLQAEESLWEVSQKYGVRLKKLIRKNRLERNEQPKTGRVLWLRFNRPAKEPIEYRETKQKKESLYASTKPAVNASIAQSEKSLFPAATTQEQADLPQEETPLTKAPTREETEPAAEKKLAQQVLTEETKALQDSAVLHPADSPVQEQKIVPELQPTAKDVQKDTVNGQKAERKFPVEKKEKNEEFSSADQTVVLEPSPSDSFEVEEPVDFIQEEEDASERKAQASVHQVKAGETLYALSRQYGITVQELIEWNKLGAQPIINIGQLLQVSPPADNPVQEQMASSEDEQETDDFQEKADQQEEKAQKANFRYHTVSAGESMYRVARMYNVTIKDIMEWNNKESFDIKEGENLIVGTEQK